MPILTELQVTDVADLRAEANNFLTHADAVKTTTSRMLEVVNSTVGVWRGDASTKYSNQFGQLGNDMEKLFLTCREYGEDLEKIAANYEKAEVDSAAQASSLKADVELV